MSDHIDIRYPGKTPVRPDFVAQGFYRYPDRLIGVLFDKSTFRPVPGKLTKKDAALKRWDVTFRRVDEGEYVLVVFDLLGLTFAKRDIKVIGPTHEEPSVFFPTDGEMIFPHPTCHGSTRASNVTGEMKDKNGHSYAPTNPQPPDGGFWERTFDDVFDPAKNNYSFKATNVGHPPGETNRSGLQIG